MRIMRRRIKLVIDNEEILFRAENLTAGSKCEPQPDRCLTHGNGKLPPGKPQERKKATQTPCADS